MARFRRCTGSGSFEDDLIAFSGSDIKLKENLVPIQNALTKVGLITGYTYNFKSDLASISPTLKHLEGTKDVGIIAQDIDRLGLSGLVTTRDYGTLAVRYERLIPILIEAIKELEARVKTLEES